MDRKRVARGLAWFGIGLGLVELLAPKKLARVTGLKGREGVLQTFGLREIASGLLLLAVKDPEKWLWVRVAGDGLDGGLLGTGLLASARHERVRALAATLTVAPVVALDVMVWLEAMQRESGGHLPTSADFVRYRDDVETVSPTEAKTIDSILASQHRLYRRNEAKFKRPVRVSHGKIHGAAVGELEVLDGLPLHLRQGLFAEPARYPVIARLSNVPGEIDTDAVATQRGFAWKVLGVEGKSCPDTQARRPKTLCSIQAIASPPRMPRRS